MRYEHIRFERADAVATVTIDRPDTLNALAPQTLAELIHAFDRIRDEGFARAALLTGAGRAFCSGADLSAAQGEDGTADRGAQLETGFNPLLERMHDLPVPLVTAVNGAAAGGGCGYALAGDIVIAARSAYFLQPFARIGLVPDVGSTWLLPRLAGRARATAMMMLGERVSAEQALDWGLIWQMVEDEALMPTARALAARLAAGPTIAYGLMRRAIADGLASTLGESLERERRDQQTAGYTDDHAEGVRAFREKREPRFSGR
ncbi:enoyl-CoA hydratase-related protein [Sphingomonas oryzagri]